jgi:hypothetical protein
MPGLGIDLVDLEIWRQITKPEKWNQILREEKLGQFNSNNQEPKVVGGSSTESIIVIAAKAIANNARSARKSFLD